MAGTISNEILTVYTDVNYRFARKWLVGAFYESAQRTVVLCEEKEDPLCKYLMRLNYGAIYIGWNCYKKHWLLIGFGASDLELGYAGDMTRKTLGGSFYLSFR